MIETLNETSYIRVLVSGSIKLVVLLERLRTFEVLLCIPIQR